MKITSTISYVGVNDHEIDLFEGQYIVPNGMAYNSYVIEDERVAVMDSVETRFSAEWLDKIRAVLGDRPADYLHVQHMEPDHSGSIAVFMAAYPQATVVATQKAFSMMSQFFGTDFADRCVIAGEGATLSLGSRELKFFTAPMVHWPEVMMTWDEKEKVFFSADAFGMFGARDTEEEWTDEARRYYFGIVGKFGAAVQTLFRKIAALDIGTICPPHGAVLYQNLGYYLEKYQTWSSYGVESEGVAVAYTSMYGNTKEAAELLQQKLLAYGCPKVAMSDLARDDMFEAVEDAFRYGKLVLASPTYNADVFPFMRTFIHHLTSRGFQSRTIGLIENGSWAPTAAKVMRGLLEGSKNIAFTDTTVTVRSVLNDESRAQIDALAKELCK